MLGGGGGGDGGGGGGGGRGGAMLIVALLAMSSRVTGRLCISYIVGGTFGYQEFNFVLRCRRTLEDAGTHACSWERGPICRERCWCAPIVLLRLHMSPLFCCQVFPRSRIRRGRFFKQGTIN